MSFWISFETRFRNNGIRLNKDAIVGSHGYLLRISFNFLLSRFAESKQFV